MTHIKTYTISKLSEDVCRNKYYRTKVIIEYLIYAAFICTDTAHCNGHGSCDDENGQCDCDIDWSTQPDCSGNVSIPYLEYIVHR